MTTTLDSDLYSIYDAKNDSRYSGVVKVSSNGYYGSGALLYDGRAILTAAHIFTSPSAPVYVTFDMPYLPEETLDVEKVSILPTHDSINANDDLAIVWLDKQAPIEAKRYDIYRNSDELGKTFAFSGFGERGTGENGGDSSLSIKKLVATNRFDTTADALKDKLGSIMSWDPNTHILAADFDSGLSSNDALGDFLGIKDLGTGYGEGLIAPGDSGGPAFIDSKIAGVAGYESNLEDGYYHPDIDNQENSSFGEVGFWQRVSDYQEFIDKSLRQNYKNQPLSKSDVQKSVIEGNAGDITINYFYLEVTGPKRDHNISVKYTTEDGTAKAGEDYIATNGEIVVYPDEDHVLIPVEIIGDNQVEGDENFYLEVFDPVGATLQDNQAVLIAQRTIVDDDHQIIA